jgi:hypothetical protein
VPSVCGTGAGVGGSSYGLATRVTCGSRLNSRLRKGNKVSLSQTQCRQASAHGPDSEEVLEPVCRLAVKVTRQSCNRQNLPAKAGDLVVRVVVHVRGPSLGRHVCASEGGKKGEQSRAHVPCPLFSRDFMADEEDVDAEALQAQIDASLAQTAALVESWLKPPPVASASASASEQLTMADFQASLRRPARYVYRMLCMRGLDEIAASQAWSRCCVA